MQEKYLSLGLMSGTSGDGVDASILYSDGIKQFEVIKDKYFEYDSEIYKNLHLLKEKISNLSDLKKFEKQLKNMERKITIFHAKIIKEFESDNIDIVGFHGQTIYHNSKEKISRQLGNGKLLFQLTKKKIVFNFRANDILNGGEGAPLTPIFHQLLSRKINTKFPVCIMNIGGITNISIIRKPEGTSEIVSKDIGPGNCLIDNWVRTNSNKKYDNDGRLAAIGKKNEIIFEQAIELYSNRANKESMSLDTSDFDISFSRGLSLEDGATTLTELTASIIGESLSKILNKEKKLNEILICGGGRKNKVLIEAIKKNLFSKFSLKSIDKFGINGDFVESQAFAYLAIRALKNLSITFPNTTNCKKPCTGGEVVDN